LFGQLATKKKKAVQQGANDCLFGWLATKKEEVVQGDA